MAEANHSVGRIETGTRPMSEMRPFRRPFCAAARPVYRRRKTLVAGPRAESRGSAASDVGVRRLGPVRRANKTLTHLRTVPIPIRPVADARRRAGRPARASQRRPSSSWSSSHHGGQKTVDAPQTRPLTTPDNG